MDNNKQDLKITIVHILIKHNLNIKDFENLVSIYNNLDNDSKKEIREILNKTK